MMKFKRIFNYCIRLVLCSLGYHKYTSWVTFHEQQGVPIFSLRLYNGFNKVPTVKIINEECIYCKKRHYYTPIMGTKYEGEPPKIITFFHL